MIYVYVPGSVEKRIQYSGSKFDVRVSLSPLKESMIERGTINAGRAAAHLGQLFEE